MSGKEFKAEDQGIGALCAEMHGSLKVPAHQRPYSWTPEDVDALFDDIEQAIADSSPDYFLGLIVLVPDGADFEILDGQQRLATTALICKALRDWFDHHQDRASVSAAEAILFHQSFGSEPRPKMVLGKADNDAFRWCLTNSLLEQDTSQLRKADPSRVSSGSKVYAAAARATDRVLQLANRFDDASMRRAYLQKFATYLQDDVFVITTRTTIESVHVMFEALNTRGVPLAVSDLVKNHLLSRAQGRQEVAKHWESIEGGVRPERTDRSDLLNAFLKAYWTVRHGRVQQHRLFKDWRKAYDGYRAEDMVELAKDIALMVPRFNGWNESGAAVWKRHSPKCKDLVRDYKLLGVDQMRPVVMAALEKFDSTQMESLLRALIVFSLRYQIVGKKANPFIEISAAKIANRIASGEISTAAEAWSILKERTPLDPEFEDQLVQFVDNNRERAKYMLRQMELVSRDRRGLMMELEPAAGLTLEHIYPTTADAITWSAFASLEKAERKRFNQRLGNQCLLVGPKNSSLKNGPFVSKKAVYAQSALEATSMVAGFPDWDPLTIEQRQRYLAQLGVLAWPLP